MSARQVIRYAMGSEIDPRQILEIINLPPDKWGPIEAVYPEVKVAGSTAGFRRQHNVTIFPPEYVSAKALKQLATYAYSQRHVYPCSVENKLVSVLVHVEGGYASLHIYRLQKR